MSFCSLFPELLFRNRWIWSRCLLLFRPKLKPHSDPPQADDRTPNPKPFTPSLAWQGPTRWANPVGPSVALCAFAVLDREANRTQRKARGEPHSFHGGRNQRPQFPPPEAPPTSFPLFCCSVPGKSGEVATRCPQRLPPFVHSGQRSLAAGPRRFLRIRGLCNALGDFASNVLRPVLFVSARMGQFLAGRFFLPEFRFDAEFALRVN